MPLSAHERDAAAACLASGGEGAAAAAKALPGGRGTRLGHVLRKARTRPTGGAGGVGRGGGGGGEGRAARRPRDMSATCPRRVHGTPLQARAAWLAFYIEE